MTLRFGVLGPVEVRDDGNPVALGGPQQRRILAALLAESGKVVAVDRLVDAIWPDAPPDGARRTVMTYVSRLRQALGDGYVETQDPGYRLVADDDGIDAVRFERLVDQARHAPPTQAVTIVDAALELWRGSAFGEFAAEWWALPYATRLEELRIVAAEDRADALIAAGEHERAATDLEGLVVAYPLRERFVAQLMKAHDGSGRQADALRAYARYRDYLAEETGLEPSEAMRALEASIVVGEGATGSRSMRGYTLGEVLGEGAFGTVYKSTQPGVGREVAVKVIRADFADDPVFVRRFEAEAQLVAHLEHPHIVPLYDFWREPGGAYLVFRLLRGGSGEALLRRDGAWELDRVDRCVREIGGALVAAHAAGVVHRDVKPANVLFDEAGNAYLTDFGIATTGVDAVPAPAGYEVVASAGSPLYAPPEQFQHAAPTPLGDQYSFAAMVWEFLTGVVPFEGESASTILRSKLQRPLPSLRARRPDVPLAVDEALQRATATTPDARFDDMTALLGAWHEGLRTATRTTDELTGDARPAPLEPMSATVAELGPTVANPYKGLRAFGEADARHFHGRAELTAKLVAEVERHPFVTVVGPSGSGKSSLVHAGLVPSLRASGMRVVSMVPSDEPFAQLRTALLTAAVREPAFGGVVEMVRSVARQQPGSLVVVLDQFEELWTLTAEEPREAFLTGLCELIGETPEMQTEDVRVVVSIRADFFDRPLAHPALGPCVAAHAFGVTPMTASELHDAVVAPADDVGVVFEPGLDSAVVAEVASQPASLPTLQFTLAELFERRQGRVINRAAYDAIGGIAGAIATRAESLYASLDADGQDAARRLLLRLVVPGDGTEDTRRRVRVSELPDGTAAVAERFEAHRLLVADRDPTTREPTVEVAHESLMRSWPRLRRWLLDDRDFIRRVQHVGTAAEAWEAAGRPESELYRGGRLDAASEILDTHAEQLTELERDFVATSRTVAHDAHERDRRARRRLRRGFVATAIALVVAIVAGSIAFVQRRSANDQRQNADRQAEAADVARLVSLSQSLTGTKLDVSMLLAVEASRRAPGAATTSALQSAMFADPSFLGYLRTGAPSGGQISFSRDGRFLYSNAQANNVRPRRIDLTTHHVRTVPVRGLDAQTGVYWFVPVDARTALVNRYNSERNEGRQIEHVDMTTGRVLGTATTAATLAEFDVSPDGRRVAVSTVGTPAAKGQLVVIDVATMRAIASVDQPGPPWDAAAHPEFATSAVWLDGSRIAFGTPSGRIAIWDMRTERIVRMFNDPPAAGSGEASVMHASSDGSTLVVERGETQTVMAYNVATGTPRWARAVAANGALAIDSRNGLVWAQEAGIGSSRVFAYDLASGDRATPELNTQHGTVCDVDVSPDTRVLYVTSCNEGTIVLWALDGRNAAAAQVAPPNWATAANLWSPDGHHVAVYDRAAEGWMDIIDVRDGSRQRVDGIDTSFASEPFFRGDGIFQAVQVGTHHVVEYDVERHTTSDTGIVLPTNILDAAAFHDRLHLSAFGTDEGNVLLVDTAKRKLRVIKSDIGPVYGVAISADGKRVFAGGQFEKGEVFDVATGKRVATLPTPVANLALSPDRTLLATSSFNGRISFYDAVTLRRSGDDMTGVTAFANKMQFTPDGNTLITSGQDSAARLFDVATRRQVGVSLPITLYGVAISPRSNEVAITTDRGVQRFRIDAGALRDAACKAAARNLTTAEWRQYVGGTPRRLCPQWPMRAGG